MALEIGDENATSGMTKAIFDQLDATLMSQEKKDKLKPADLDNIRTGWRKLAFALAKALVPYLTGNMEISGIQTTGTVTVDVKDSGGTEIGTGTSTVSSTQSGPTTGHVT